jgi:hypothetical protein
MKMFDANMRHLPKGHLFFAKVHYCSDCTLYEVGMRSGDIIRCEMLSEGDDNPEVKFYFGNGTFTTHSDIEYEESWLVYEGNLDGTGFIDKSSKKKVQSIIDYYLKENQND